MEPGIGSCTTPVSSKIGLTLLLLHVLVPSTSEHILVVGVEHLERKSRKFNIRKRLTCSNY